VGNKIRYIIKDREQSKIAEAFRVIRGNLLTAQGEMNLKSVLFAGASPGEGNAMTAVNTAVTLAYSGKKVVLVDCDLRDPIIQDVFGLRKTGVTNLIGGGKTLEEVLQNTGIDNLKVITSGPVPEKPLELLSNETMKSMIDQLSDSVDFVIVNSSPLILAVDPIISDACLLASKVDGVVLVVDAGTVRIHTAKKVMEFLKGARARIVGTILNEIQDDREFVYYTSSAERIS
jgi:capsular exopolysaccharide synthesis family protein